MEGAFEDETVIVSNSKQVESSKDEQPAIKNMTPAQKRLFELRLKRNQARKENLQQVVEEDSRQNEPVNAEIKRAKVEYDENRAKEKEDMVNKGLDPEKEKVLNVTASEAQWKEAKRSKTEKNRENSFGWDQYNPEAQHNLHSKRFWDSKLDLDEYNRQKATLPSEDFYREANYVNYGQAPPTEKAKVDQMLEELEKTMEKRRKFSRKRKEDFDTTTVDYINKQNQVFNKKVARAFNKYTAEIKANLERGTAL